MYKDPEPTAYETAVEYDGDLLQAASELLSLVDEDGITVGDEEWYEACKEISKRFRVSKRDLVNRFKELAE